jgi:hypothetical protein
MVILTILTPVDSRTLGPDPMDTGKMPGILPDFLSAAKSLEPASSAKKRALCPLDAPFLANPQNEFN